MSPDEINAEGITNGSDVFLRELDGLRRIYLAKSAGYVGQDNPDPWANFREATALGLTPLLGCLVRMGDKYKRIQNLTRNADNERVNESRKDTLRDLANYAIIAVCLILEEEEAAAKKAADELHKSPIPRGGFGPIFEKVSTAGTSAEGMENK